MSKSAARIIMDKRNDMIMIIIRIMIMIIII